jgi:dUTP pyrophosphatase
MSLFLWIPDQTLRTDMRLHVRNRRWTDSGLDILCPAHELDFSKSKLAAEIKTGIHAAALDSKGNPVPYLLLVRSSTSLTPLRQSNQIGLADAGYRGELIARVDCADADALYYTIEYGRRLFQICQNNWLPWDRIEFVDSLDALPKPPDGRGDGGFGSTGC